MLKKILILSVIPVITACATPYEPQHREGAPGFSDTVLGEATRAIRVNGNKFTSRIQLHEMAILRAAELARESGYPFIEIQEIESWSLQTLYETSGAHQQIVTDKKIVSGPDITLAAPESGEPDLAAHILRADRTAKPQMKLVVAFHRMRKTEQSNFIKVSDIFDQFARKYNRPE